MYADPTHDPRMHGWPDPADSVPASRRGGRRADERDGAGIDGGTTGV